MEGILGNLLGGISMTTVLIFVVIFLVCFTLLKRSNLPPGPLRLPVLGSVWWFLLLSIKKARLPRELFKLSKTYGDVIHFQVLSQNLVVIHGYDAIQEAFVKRASDFSSRPSHLFDNVQKGAKGVAFSNGHLWKVLRKLTMQSMKDFGVGKTSIEDKILVEIDAATEYLKSTKEEPSDLRHLTNMVITNVINGIVFGKRYDYSEQLYHEVIENLDVALKDGVPFNILSRLPAFIWRLVGNKKRAEGPARFKRSNAWVDDYINNQIKEHEETYDGTNIRDFVDLFIQAKQTESDTSSITDRNLFYTIQDLFVAGSDTTSNTLNWIVLFMQEYPDVQEQCQAEILQKYGGRTIRWADRGTLPFVESTLLEIQRMANIAELTLPHTTLEDTTFRGYRIPKGSVVQANLFSSNMDSRHWDEPEIFKPDRFLQDGKVTKNPALIPFSMGPRVCLGENLAKMELFLVFTNFLQRFSFKKELGTKKHTFNCIEGQLTSAPLPYKTIAMYIY